MSTLLPEDYQEPQCPLCLDPGGRTIPQRRVQEKLDQYMSRRDYEGGERHLLYWLEEARACRDQRGELLVRNEMIGFYRKRGEKEKALTNAGEAVALLNSLGLGDSITAGTTWVNAATAHHAFGEPEEALALFSKAKAIYESSPQTGADLLGGLYNNMALACVDLGRFQEAQELYDKAMAEMGKVPGGELEQAITCLNRANAVEAQEGLEAGESKIYALLDQAQELLENSKAPRNGYFAFVCEKCAPVFSYYGYFQAANALQKLAEDIYAGT